MKKLYKIRNKETGEFISAGYNRKRTWLVYPSAVIDNNPHIFSEKTKFEIVVYEYKESEIIELK